MPRFCANCGAQMEDSAGFCPACGKPVGETAGGGIAAAPAPTATATGTSGLQPGIAGLLCYIPVFPVGLVISIVFLVVAPYNRDRFIRFHAFQSIFLTVACIAVSVALMIVGSVFSAIWFVLAALMIPIWGIFWIGVLVLVIVCMIKAAQNQMWKIPFIGDLAEKQANA